MKKDYKLKKKCCRYIYVTLRYLVRHSVKMLQIIIWKYKWNVHIRVVLLSNCHPYLSFNYCCFNCYLCISYIQQIILFYSKASVCFYYIEFKDFFFLLILAPFVNQQTVVNISSIYPNYSLSRTIDGNFDQSASSCSHTDVSSDITEAWLRIDLGLVYSVKSVKIWYRGDSEYYGRWLNYKKKMLNINCSFNIIFANVIRIFFFAKKEAPFWK